MPNLVREIARQLASQAFDVAESLPFPPVTGGTERFPLKQRPSFLNVFFSGREGIGPGPGFFDFIDRDAPLQNRLIGSERRQAPHAQYGGHPQDSPTTMPAALHHTIPSFLIEWNAIEKRERAGTSPYDRPGPVPAQALFIGMSWELVAKGLWE